MKTIRKSRKTGKDHWRKIIKKLLFLVLFFRTRFLVGALFFLFVTILFAE